MWAWLWGQQERAWLCRAMKMQSEWDGLVGSPVGTLYEVSFLKMSKKSWRAGCSHVTVVDMLYCVLEIC